MRIDAWRSRSAALVGRWWANRRRRWITLAVVVLLVAIRIALPAVVRWQIESQTRAAVAGTLQVGDVDLWLLRGAIGLDDVTFRADGQPAEAPPLAAFRRLYVNLGWFALLRGTIRLQSVELDAPAVNLVRDASGALELPALVPSPPAPEAAPSEPWNVELDRVAIEGGLLRLVDHMATPPAPVEVALQRIDLGGFTLEHEAEKAPAEGALALRLGDGTLRVGAQIDRRPDGFWIEIKVDADALPIDGLQVHQPGIGWSRLVGRLEGSVRVQIAPTGLPTMQGTVALRNVAIDVPGEDRPVLSWDAIVVEAESIDSNSRTISITRLEIERPLVEFDRERDGVVAFPVSRAIDLAAPPAKGANPADVAPPTPGDAPAAATPALALAPSPAPPSDAPTPDATPERVAESMPTPSAGDLPEPSPIDLAAGGVPTSGATAAAGGDEPAVADAAAPSPRGAEPFPWDVFIHSAGLQRGQIRFVDRLVDPVETTDIELDGINLSGFEIKRSGDRRPGEGAVELHFGDGTIKITADVTMREAGVAANARIEAANVPLDRLYVHLPQLGWSGFRGRLDSNLQVALEPGTLPTASGTLAVRDLQVDVSGESAPVLAWGKVEVDAQTIDPGAKRAVLKRVSIEKAALEVRPRDPVPLPILTGITKWMRDDVAPAAEVAGASAAAEKEHGKDSGWTWSIGEVAVADSSVAIVDPSSRRPIGIDRALVTGLASDPAAPVAAELDLREGGGTVAIRASVVREPLAGKATVKLAKLALGPIVDSTPTSPVALRSGTAEGDLQVAIQGGDLTLSGLLILSAVDVVARDAAEAKDFASAWERLEIEVRKIEVPSFMASPGDAAGSRALAASPSEATAEGAARGSSVRSARPAEPGGAAILVDLARVKLVRPTALVTRTAAGIVLPRTVPAPAPDQPSSGGAPSDVATAAGPAPTPAPSPIPAAAPTPLSGPSATAAPAAADGSSGSPAMQIRIAQLDVEGGDVTIVDRTVQPFFRGKVTALKVRATALRMPEATFGDVDATARLPGDAPFTLRSQRDASGVKLEGSIERLPLPPFNPYVTGAAGYSIPSGSAKLSSTAWWGPTYYGSWNDVTLDDFEVAGAEGNTLFADQFGISLSLALGLLRSPGGAISLGIPIEGDRARGASVALGPIVGQAIFKAILGAITSPLRLIGAVAFGGDKVAAVKPSPIAFAPGLAEVAGDAWWRVDELANALASFPGLKLTLRGNAGGPDVRALQELAVLADLQKEQGVLGTLRTLTSRGDRSAVREYLEARFAGKPAELDEDRRPALEEWVAAKSVDDAALTALAAKRAESLQALLETSYGVRAASLPLGEPVVARDGGLPEVSIGVAGD